MLLGPKESKTAALLKTQSDGIARDLDSGDNLASEGIEKVREGVLNNRAAAAVAASGNAASASIDAAEEVASTAIGVVSAAKSFARAAKSFSSWARAKMRRRGTATKYQGSPTSPISRDAPPYDEEHAGPPEQH